MNARILHPEVQEFIIKNLKADIFRLLLQPSPFPGLSSRELAEQIEARARAREKLPGWFSTPGIYFPNKRHLEQSSSEVTAAYKSQIVNAPKKVFDLSGGFGVDSYYFSKAAQKLVYCETIPDLASIARHNFGVLGAHNIEVLNEDGLAWLRKSGQKADLIYLDPSRRSRENNRVFLLADCHPNVPEHLELLFSGSPNVLVKSSPLLDLKAGLTELRGAKEIHIVAVNNEVKEVLWLLEKEETQGVSIKTINFGKETEEFSFPYQSESQAKANFSEPLAYLFEPNAAILKSGGFKSLGQSLQIAKLDEHTHLYTSRELTNFPGRVFRIRNVMPYARKSMGTLPEKANVSTRNFPLNVTQIRKRHGISDGGDNYLFFARSAGKGLIVIECEKI